MEDNQVAVRIIETEDGRFVARAIGYPGVIAYGSDKYQVFEDVKAVWRGMANFNAIQKVGGKFGPIYSGGGKSKAEDTTFRPQAI